MPSYIVEVVMQGPAGPGFAGGTTGQVLAKASGANFDYVWSTVGAGSATWGGISGTLSAQADLQAALDGKAASSHTHDDRYYTESETDTLLSAKLASSAASAFGLMLIDDADAGTARTTLGLGTAAVAATGDFATAAQGALAATALQAGAVIPWADVSGKPTFAAVATSGAYGDLSGLPSLFSGAYGDLSGIPSTFAPSTHSHAISDVTGLQSALDAKVDDSQVTAFGLTLLDDADAATARTTLGLHTATINATIDGGGSAISTGIKGDVSIPFACTITGVTALADQTGSIVVDVWRSTYSAYPPVDGGSLTASAPITISAAAKSQDTTLTGWTTSLVAGDVLRFNVDSAATITRLHIQIAVTR